MTLVINMLHYILPLHTKMKNYHIKYPKCYPKCHDVNNFSLTKVTYVDE